MNRTMADPRPDITPRQTSIPLRLVVSPSSERSRGVLDRGNVSAMRLPFTMLLLLLCVAAQIGCKPGEPAAVQKQTSNMRGLAVAYGQYTSQNRGRPPKNEKALREFVEAQGPGFLESFQIDSVDEMFTSPRDGEPYVVIYGKRSSVVAYEKVGVDGRRYVAYDIGGAEEVDEAKFRELVPDAE